MSSSKEISIPSKVGHLQGLLTLPAQTQGIVLFAHGSGSGRHSPRNQFVARFLNEGGLATLLMDLLTPEEEEIDLLTRDLRFDISLLAHRLEEATDYLLQLPETKDLNIGYFGASTGAAAALVAAAVKGALIKAVVSRGGRPDLADQFLGRVQAPTLLIIGGADDIVITLNQQALKQLKGEKQLVLVPHATHLFEEPGTLEEVAQLSRNWFNKYLNS